MKRLEKTAARSALRHKTKTISPLIHQFKIIESPVGPLTLVASETALICLNWGICSPMLAALDIKHEHPVLVRTEIQLREYFEGQRKNFDLPLDLQGTEFQQQVWRELSKISYGQTITYGEQAKRLGRPKSARAVGAANGKNPIGIIVPCHRVVGASGSLTGFAGGIEVKRQLLAIESKAVGYSIRAATEQMGNVSLFI